MYRVTRRWDVGGGRRKSRRFRGDAGRRRRRKKSRRAERLFSFARRRLARRLLVRLLLQRVRARVELLQHEHERRERGAAVQTDVQRGPRRERERHGDPRDEAVALHRPRLREEVVKQRLHHAGGREQREHAAPDQRAEHGFGQVRQQRPAPGDDEQDETQAGHAVREPRLGARLDAEGGPRDDAGDVHAPRQPRADVRHALRDELLVRVPRLAVVVRPEAAHRRTLQVRDHAHGDAGNRERLEQLGRHRERGGGP
mmetsp:Transcript_12764/g.54610  ORF Transcript_12764/g.54610 Transcript_12764/m.54610 type:complete len:256 (+) Transcript_12764:1576-2343(+)